MARSVSLTKSQIDALLRPMEMDAVDEGRAVATVERWFVGAERAEVLDMLGLVADETGV